MTSLSHDSHHEDRHQRFDGEIPGAYGDGSAHATRRAPPRTAPRGVPFSAPDVEDSDTALDLDRITDALAVVDGGVVGCEYACLFAVRAGARRSSASGARPRTAPPSSSRPAPAPPSPRTPAPGRR